VSVEDKEAHPHDEAAMSWGEWGTENDQVEHGDAMLSATSVFVGGFGLDEQGAMHLARFFAFLLYACAIA